MVHVCTYMYYYTYLHTHDLRKSQHLKHIYMYIIHKDEPLIVLTVVSGVIRCVVILDGDFL